MIGYGMRLKPTRFPETDLWFMYDPFFVATGDKHGIIADKDLAKGSFILGRPLHNTHINLFTSKKSIT